MTSIDALGPDRVDRIERAIRALFQSVKRGTESVLDMTKTFLREAWDLAGVAVLLSGIVFLVILALCRFALPLATEHRILYGTLQWVCLILLFLSMFVSFGVVTFLLPLFCLLAIVWFVPIAAWVGFSPLLVGSYLKERFRLGRAVSVAGVLLMSVGFYLLFSASFKR